MIVLTALAGVLVAGGLITASSGLRPAGGIGARDGASWWSRLPDGRQTLATVALGAVAFLVTRWPVALVAGAAVGWTVAGGSGRSVRRTRQDKTSAIALWTEMLRDAVGTARGVEGVLIATAATAPPAIREEVQRMAHRLESEPFDDAIAGLADDLDHGIADLVVTALRITASAGGTQVRDVLGSLSAAAHAEAGSRARLEVARERPRAAMRYTALIIAGFVVLLVAFSRPYLEPYGTPVGQLVMVIVGLYWTAGFWWMARMGREPQAERFVTGRSPEPAP